MGRSRRLTNDHQVKVHSAMSSLVLSANLAGGNSPSDTRRLSGVAEEVWADMAPVQTLSGRRSGSTAAAALGNLQSSS